MNTLSPSAVKYGISKSVEWFLWRRLKRRSRIALAELTDDQLADIGVTRTEARQEAVQPFWR